MIKSMTAYGRCSQSTPLGNWVVEIHSVNRKMLDIAISLPRELLRFELEIRKWVAHQISRGQLTVRVHRLMEKNGAGQAAVLLSQLQTLKESWEGLAKELGYDAKKSVDLHFLAHQLQLAAPQDWIENEEEVQQLLKQLVDEALRAVMKLKEEEGRLLAADMKQRLKEIEKGVVAIESMGSEVVDKYRKRLEERLHAAAVDLEDNGERLLREVVLFADRIDISEELTRLRSHIAQFIHYLGSTEKSVGKTLEFLIQEMSREMNTLSAKSVDLEITAITVRMRSELEKIKEQVQNIE